MPGITHVFFDLHGTLVDAVNRLPEQWGRALGDYMAGRYGGTPEAWAEANRRIMADWDSYFADLDFSADDGLAQAWEGEVRVIRAQFRLVGLPYPTPEAMQELLQGYHYAITSRCDGLFPDARAALEAICAMPLTLGVVSHAFRGQAEGLLTGAGLRDWFAGPMILPEDVGYFGKDEGYFLLAVSRVDVSADRCVVVDDSLRAVQAAIRAGLRAVLVDRAQQHIDERHVTAITDLEPLPDILRGWLG